MMPIARALLLGLLVAWPLQPLDDAMRAWVKAHQDPGTHAFMGVVSSKSRVVLISGAVLGLAAGASGRAFVAEAAVALLPVNGVVELLKWTVGRTRPDGDTHRRNSSFPSSHAANAFTMAAVLTRRWPRSAIPAWLAAALVAFSRLYLDRHWLSDVLFSALLALAGAWCSAWLLRRWRERNDARRTS